MARENMTVRVEADTRKRLARVAKAARLSRGQVVEAALRQSFERWAAAGGVVVSTGKKKP